MNLLILMSSYLGDSSQKLQIANLKENAFLKLG